MAIDQTICTGNNCPSRENCLRYTKRPAGAHYAALWARREAGAMACDKFEPAGLSTFEAKPYGGAA